MMTPSWMDASTFRGPQDLRSGGTAEANGWPLALSRHEGGFPSTATP